MNPSEVVAILEQRIYHLGLARADAATRGDLGRVAELDADITATRSTVAALSPVAAEE